jgi:hypothetical protein
MKLSRNFYNWMSLAGVALAANSLLVIVVLFLFSMFSENSNTYLGLFIYIIVPMFLVIGLLMIPLGIILKIRKKEAPGEEVGNWPVFNFNDPKFRKGFFAITMITIVLLLISAMGSYEAFKYSESVEFCGTLCHKVMEPEYVSYQHSPHARVACVECHVGEGAGWYMKSKLSGLYQVYSVTFKKYARPIETPLHNLRPARETCERCHWPEKFYSRKLVNIRSYLTDSASTEWNNSLMMKIGPEFSSLGHSEGIHWHINKDFKIEYASTTNDRESIPWVKMTNLKTGEVKTFMDEENPIEKAALDTPACQDHGLHGLPQPAFPPLQIAHLLHQQCDGIRKNPQGYSLHQKGSHGGAEGHLYQFRFSHVRDRKNHRRFLQGELS